MGRPDWADLYERSFPRVYRALVALGPSLTSDIASSIVLSVSRKTLDDLKGNPKHVTPEELAAVLRDHGWELRPGTLHGTIAVKGSRTFHFPRPHGQHLLPVYVRRAVKIIEEEE